jgi:ORF6N domain
MAGNNLVTIEQITTKIYHIRGSKVMLDRDLAMLYEVETRILNQAVKRQTKRFPNDFMFQLTKAEFNILKSQFVTSSWGGVRKMPMAFTEQGVAMLSGILNSDRAIQVNIQIMRTFTKLRHMIAGHEELQKAVDELREQTDKRFEVVFSVLDKLLVEDEKPKIMGGLFDLFSKTLKRLPGIKIVKPPRMADFTRLGEAISQVLGNEPDAFVSLYHEARQQAIINALDGSPVALAIQDLLDRAGRLDRVLMKDALEKLSEYRPWGEAWPKSQRGLSDILRRNKPGLKAIGIRVDRPSSVK